MLIQLSNLDSNAKILNLIKLTTARHPEKVNYVQKQMRCDGVLSYSQKTEDCKFRTSFQITQQQINQNDNLKF